MNLSWISLEFEPLYIASIWFGVFIAHYKFNGGYWIRRVLGLSQTKGYKLIECFPCQAFWIAVLLPFAITWTINPLTAMIVYYMSQTTKIK